MGSQKRTNKILKEHDTYFEIDVSTKKHPGAVALIDKQSWRKRQKKN